MRVWYIAKGQLWRGGVGEPPTAVESRFIQDCLERQEQSKRAQGWKHAPREDYQGIIPASSLWGRGGGGGETPPPRFEFAVRGPNDDTVYYVLSVAGSTGLFEYRLSEQREIRLFHRADLPCVGLAYEPAGQRLVLAARNKDGTANLVVFDADGSQKGGITGGDAFDCAPFCPVADAGAILYQSSGVARHPQYGHSMGIGPATVMRLRYATGALDVLLEDAKFDFLTPRQDRAGNLYCIRRPYQGPHGSQTGLLQDIVMFPWRLLKAVFGYLNFFSAIYGREPLRSSGGPPGLGPEQNLAQMWLQGRLVDLRQARFDEQRGGGLVPADWQLIRRTPRGDIEVLAEHVVSFDLSADDRVIYTNGYELKTWAQGRSERLYRIDLIEQVAAA